MFNFLKRHQVATFVGSIVLAVGVVAMAIVVTNKKKKITDKEELKVIKTVVTEAAEASQVKSNPQHIKKNQDA